MKKNYQVLIKKQSLQSDPAQLIAVDVLAHLSEQLTNKLDNQLSSKRSFWFKKQDTDAIKGVYLYGTVGRGKTMLMDMFFQNIDLKNKKRIHFHRFMESVHRQLTYLKKQENPLSVIAQTWAKEFDLLCFDEFYVSDIADAMLLSGLLQELFKLNVVLVATSNSKPEQLYRNGLQRERFLPTITLINDNCQVIAINGEKDHRLNGINEKTQYRDYFFPHNKFLPRLKQEYDAITEQAPKAGDISINGRKIAFIARQEDVIWFEFSALCSGPRSQRDYIALADTFNTVLISHVPCFSGKLIPPVFSGVEDSYQRSGVLMGELCFLDDEARRFIALVDEFYERKVRLIVTAEVDINQLYKGKQLSFEFARCESRLFEMQKLSYE